mmetsp:Transcript_45741/g.110861  ORF Transcript_45741/g.110861 Transcript_45741/m.110861 type:complete len:207 (+) Transcript_45741:382-1002(+)
MYVTSLSSSSIDLVSQAAASSSIFAVFVSCSLSFSCSSFICFFKLTNIISAGGLVSNSGEFSSRRSCPFVFPSSFLLAEGSCKKSSGRMVGVPKSFKVPCSTAPVFSFTSAIFKKSSGRTVGVPKLFGVDTGTSPTAASDFSIWPVALTGCNEVVRSIFPVLLSVCSSGTLVPESETGSELESNLVSSCWSSWSKDLSFGSSMAMS